MFVLRRRSGAQREPTVAGSTQVNVLYMIAGISRVLDHTPPLQLKIPPRILMNSILTQYSRATTLSNTSVSKYPGNEQILEYSRRSL